MKITEIRTYLMQVGGPLATPAADAKSGTAGGDFRGSRNWLFVKVLTDEGTYGVGECSGWPRVIETAVKDLANLLVGQDPANIDLLWNKMHTATMGHGLLGTVGGGAMTGIEMALWDIKGKALGQPVWNLLGGRFRDRIPVYGHAKTRERADQLLALGYKGIKAGVVTYKDVETVYDLRAHVGPDVDLMVDAHGPPWFTTADAIAVGRELEGADLLFYEDPVAPENLDALARVREAVDIPIAAGERVSTIWGIRPYVERDLVDVIQPDTGRAGGITQMRKMAAMA
ncbi:MAG: mandelate racemase/muconate lactonizing enzyme family protein, partial [Devosia sp.]|nr:mandelate racemase/muconate lactonizing enzyme family protein [Devosia sp.]